MSDIRIDKNLTIADLSYAAATMDCEGCIQITMRKPSIDTQNPRFGVLVIVVNTDSVLTNWLHDSFGGGVTVKDKEYGRTAYTWYASTKPACKFLLAILPYLKLKWEQAELAIKLGNLTGEHNTKRLTDEEILKRWNLKEAVHALNNMRRPNE